MTSAPNFARNWRLPLRWERSCYIVALCVVGFGRIAHAQAAGQFSPHDAPAEVRRYQQLLLGVVLLSSLSAGTYLWGRPRRRRRQETRVNQLVEQRAAALSTSLRRITDADVDLESFAHTVGRDLLAPLRDVSRALQQIDRQTRVADSPNAEDYLTSAQDSVAHIDRFVDEVLAFSRVHQDVRLSPKRIPLPSFFSQLGTELRAAHPARVIDFRIEGDGEVLAPPAPLRKIFANLLENAVRYNEHPIVRIGVTVRRINEQIRVEVSDNGIGIAEQHHERVFALFKRLQPTDPQRGTGLGLAVARRIATRLGGGIKLTSRLGHGSVFTVTLPVDTTPVVGLMAAQAGAGVN